MLILGLRVVEDMEMDSSKHSKGEQAHCVAFCMYILVEVTI